MTALPGQTQRQLNLTRVEYCAGRSVTRIRRAFPIECRRSGTTGRARILGAEIRRCITCVEVPNVDGVQQIEGFGQGLEAQLFINAESAFQTNVDGLQRISLESVARLVADPIVVTEHIAVRVKARVFGEVLRRLQGKNHAESEIARGHVPVLRAGEDGVTNEAMPG